MMKMDLSILIPSRNEMFLKNTVEDILKNMRGNTEVIVCLDGQWSDPPIMDDDRVTIIYVPESIGQRAGQNVCARVSRAKYVMKVDAHCNFDEGFDVKMLDAFKRLEDSGETNITMVPVMRNLHVFDWKCMKCGKKWYQGPVPEKCQDPNCDGKRFKRKIVWRAKRSPNSTSYYFNNEMEFKYFGEYKAKQIGDLVETMSLQGSCFMARRENYWENELCDESWGSWGGQGAEVAVKTWLSGGRVICNKNTWYAHMFRTQPGFSHPYPNPARDQQRAKDNLRRIFLVDNWPKAKRKLSWIIEKFSPVPTWENAKR
jgi:glycosyltransferase involved in cell wall biosynthesis